MFGHKDKQSAGRASAKSDADESVHANLIVHNMPAASRLSSALATTPSAAKKKSSFSSARTMAPRPVKHNFQMVGILIIGGGVIFIALLFFLSYRYIILPAAKTPVSPASSLNVPASVATSSDESTASSSDNSAVAPISLDNATTSALTSATATVLDLGTSTASTTDASILNQGAAPLLDSDNDGLNDEEEAVFGTNPNLADTNNNSFDDRTEILNNHNPLGSGALSADPYLKTYTSTAFGYSVLAPKDWLSKSINNDNTVLFNAPDNSLIQISLQDNTDKQSIQSWYADSFPDDAVTYARVKTTATWDGIMSSDGFNFYLTDKKHKNIYIVSYIPATDSRVAYPTVFQMMINSLVLK